MKITSVFSSVAGWIHSTELLVRPSSQILGKWKLYEYYTEPGEELCHLEEKQLEKENQYWEIEFRENGQLYLKSNIHFQNKSEKLRWNRTGMFINFIDIVNSEKNVEFRYAIDKGVLKLLKKDLSGKIDFFGFFKRPDVLVK